MNQNPISQFLEGFFQTAGPAGEIVAILIFILALFWVFMPVILWLELRSIRKQLEKLNAGGVRRP